MFDDRKVHFIGIGAQKAGTSWLYNKLSELEEFDLLPIKELNYFDRDESYASSNKLSQDKYHKRFRSNKHFYNAIKNIIKCVLKLDLGRAKFYVKWNFANIDDRWYVSLFKDRKGFTGEITPSYMFLEQEDIIKMKNLLPGIKLVLLLRNPIDRAWSSFRYSRKRTPNFDINKVDLADILEFMESEGQSLRTDYLRAIQNYTAIFDKKDILIGFYDAIIDKPQELFQDILKHICGKNTVISIDNVKLKEVVNQSSVINCPPEIRNYLKLRYHSMMKVLSESYGGYFTKWFEETYNDETERNYGELRVSTYLDKNVSI